MNGQAEQDQSASGVRRSICKDPDSSFLEGKSNFEWQHCAKTFKFRCRLQTHILKHSGIKNYEWQQCGKRYTKKSNLTKDTITHSGVRNHECQQCGKRPWPNTILLRTLSCGTRFLLVKSDARRHYLYWPSRYDFSEKGHLNSGKFPLIPKEYRIQKISCFHAVP